MDILCKRDLDHDGLEITKEETICIARDILLGLVAIHKANIIHHDLKVNNVLVHLTTSKIPVKARIIDFNYSCFDHETKEKQEVGLAVYSPPEFCKVIYETEGKTDPRFIPVTTLAMDVWSAGCMLYQIFFDKDLPWFKLVDSDDSSKKDNVRSALEVSLLLDEWIPKQFHSHPLYPLVSSMLRVNPADRITAEGALELFEQCARTAQAEDI